MTFQKLDRPATDADIKARNAIFTLAGAGRQVRIVQLKSLPTQAKWKTLERFVVRGQTYDEKTKGQKIVTSFDQLALVWQAEEVLEDGQWKRNYGFVGHHIVARAPAEEVELFEDRSPSDPRWR